MTRSVAFGFAFALLAADGALACGGDREIDLLRGKAGAAGSAGSASGGSSGACTTNGCELGEVCDAWTGECAPPCGPSLPCTSGDRPFCNLARSVCVECESDLNCTESHRCLLPAGECVECLGDGDCLEPTQPICGADHQCRGG